MSLQSETTMTSADEADIELEEIIFNLMSKSGLLADMKGQISKFIQENGKIGDNSVHVIRERADPDILTYIYEYLQWVGMKNSCATILAESPVEIFDKVIEPENKIDPNFRPALHSLFQKSENPEKSISFREASYASILKDSNGICKPSGGAEGEDITFESTPRMNKTYTASTDVNKSSDLGTPKAESQSKTNTKTILDDSSVNNLLNPQNETTTELKHKIKEHQFDSSKSLQHSRNTDEKENQDQNSDVGTKNTDAAKSEKSDSDHFEEESISELLEGLSLDNNTEDVTISSNANDDDCEHVMPLS